MKKWIVFPVTILILNLASAQDSATLKKFEKLTWLEGNWHRIKMKPGQSGQENWKKISPWEMQGLALTMKGKDTVFVEKASLLIRDNRIYYVADVPENNKPVYFELTAISDQGFTCENPEHDFPKKISYQKTEGEMIAVISGN